MKQKTIFFTVTNDLVYDQRMIRICTSLSNNGYSVKLIGRKRNSSKSLDDSKYLQKRINCFFEKGKFFYIEYNFRLFWFLLFSKFDAVCCIDLDTLLPGYIASKLKGKTCIYDAHEYFTEVPEVVNRPLVKGIWAAVGKFIIPRLKYCYTVCESLSEVFWKKYKTKFEVIRNVPYQLHENSTIKASRDEKIILYQGALNAGRGLEQTIEAMKLIKQSKLWLVGEGDLSLKLRQLVKAENLEEKVIFKGYLKPSELMEITAKATIGINLLENTSLNYYYSLANKAFDYIQAKIPAIHMNFPEYKNLNEAFEVALLIDDIDPKTITATVNKILDDKDLYDDLVQNCNKAKKVFIWEVEEEKLLYFYKNVFKPESTH
jgi:glycosyltransferase involved in cell wall biosynthesis